MWFTKESLNIINLSKGNQAELVRFKDVLEDCRQADIWTHAFFTENCLSLTPIPVDLAYREERDTALEACRKEGSLLVMLEGVNTYRNLAARLKHLGFKGDVYAFMTLAVEPTPLISGYNQDLHQLSLPDGQRELNWDIFTGLLPQNQRISLQLGGEYLIFFDSKDCNNQNPKRDVIINNLQTRLAQPEAGNLFDKDGKKLSMVPRYCAGITGVELAKRGISASFSLPTWPNGLWRDASHYFG